MNELQDRQEDGKCVWKSIGCNIIDWVGPDSCQPFRRCSVSSHFEWHYNVLIRQAERAAPARVTTSAPRQHPSFIMACYSQRQSGILRMKKKKNQQ